ncbi:hypothetical protein C3B79_3747 [Aeromonas hydrophila]|nr:hypothetical protein C3B79_3747 [Aeromonas hydrophila]
MAPDAASGQFRESVIEHLSSKITRNNNPHSSHPLAGELSCPGQMFHGQT